MVLLPPRAFQSRGGRMSKAPELEVADAMLAVIAGASLSLSVVATRRDYAVEALEDLTDVRVVHVIPSGLLTTHQSRGKWLDIVSVDVGLIAKSTTENQASIDGLRWLREEIKRTFVISNESLSLTPSGDLAQLIDVQTTIPIWAAKLKQTGCFVGVMQYQWRVM